MTRAEALLLWVLATVAGGSGIVLGVMKYLMTPSDPYAVVGHPWQPWALAVHVVATPLLGLHLGWLLAVHARPRFRLRVAEGRRTGLLSVAATVPMIVSGAFIQTSTSPRWIAGAVGVHLGTSGLFLLGFAVHVALTWRRARALALQRSLARQETA